MADGVIIGDKHYPLVHPATGAPIKVMGVQDHKMEFKPGVGANKKRVAPISLGVVHWTGGEGDAESMFATLQARELGVEYCIDAHGTLYQFCDMMKVDTADANAANKISWGVEVVNAGLRVADWHEPSNRKPKMGIRHAYDATIHNTPVLCWDFYPEQLATLCALNKLIAAVVPTYDTAVCTASSVIDWQTFRGAIGHYHITKQKLDPGPKPLQDLSYFMQTGSLARLPVVH